MTLRDILTSHRQLAILRRQVSLIAAERDAARADLQRARDTIERLRLDRVQVGLRAGFDVGALEEALAEARDERDRLKAALDAERSALLLLRNGVNRALDGCDAVGSGETALAVRALRIERDVCAVQRSDAQARLARHLSVAAHVACPECGDEDVMDLDPETGMCGQCRRHALKGRAP